jgi:hypothetical protein
MQNPASLFSTVSRTDHLGFWADHILQPRSVAKFLDLQKEDLARIAQVARSSVRFDQKTPKEVLERIEEIANVCTLVAGFFDGNAERTALWFRTPNPQFGDISPRDMIRYGRYKRLLQFVLAALDANAMEGKPASVKHAPTSTAAAH